MSITIFHDRNELKLNALLFNKVILDVTIRTKLNLFLEIIKVGNRLNYNRNACVDIHRQFSCPRFPQKQFNHTFVFKIRRCFDM